MTETLTTHPQTGRPIAEVPTFEVGDLVTERVNSDGYPAVVVAATAKTVWVSSVDYVVNAQDGDRPGHDGYGDSATLVIDPDSVEEALAAGKEGASKYVLWVSPRPSDGSFNDEEKYGGSHHRAKYRRPGSPYTVLTRGARYRRDPHL